MNRLRILEEACDDFAHAMDPQAKAEALDRLRYALARYSGNHETREIWDPESCKAATTSA